MDVEKRLFFEVGCSDHSQGETQALFHPIGRLILVAESYGLAGMGVIQSWFDGSHEFGADSVLEV